MSAADVSGKFYKAQNNMASTSFILEDFPLLRGCHRIEIQDLSRFSLKIPEALKKFWKNRNVQICIQRGKRNVICNMEILHAGQQCGAECDSSW